MKRILRSPFIVSLLLVLTGSVQAQDLIHPFFELTDEDLARIDLHDGSVDDWLDVLGEPTLNVFDFMRWKRVNFQETQVAYDQIDLDFRIWLAWHDATNRFYIAMERADDVYLNNFDRSAVNSFMGQHDSSVSFIINGSASGIWPSSLFGLYERGSAEYLLNVPRETQGYTTISEAPGDEPLVIIDELVNAVSQHGDWYARPPYAESAGTHFGERPTLSVTEFYVTPFDQLVWNDPSASVVSDLYPGKAVRFVLGVIDAEGSFTSGSFDDSSIYIIRSVIKNGVLQVADGVLLGSDSALPEEEDTAVENDSWGRIKASFR